MLIDYLGASDNPYVRAVTRKTLCAAISRVLTPGIKFDSMLVLNGPQGVGKSTLIAKLGGDWFSDSLSLSDTKDKTAAEKLQGYICCFWRKWRIRGIGMDNERSAKINIGGQEYELILTTKATVFDDKLTVEFKSGVEIDIEI